MPPATDERVLSLMLPGVVIWRRPRKQKGRTGIGYPEQYAQERFAWACQVQAQVRAAGWDANAVKRYSVRAVVSGRGRFDLDRVQTAVLDALQSGGAITEDSRVYELMARRDALPKGQEAQVNVRVQEDTR